MRWAGYITHMREMRSAYKIYVGKLGRPVCRWEDNIKWIFKE
jgi:hypothetical protein